MLILSRPLRLPQLIATSPGSLSAFKRLSGRSTILAGSKKPVYSLFKPRSRCIMTMTQLRASLPVADDLETYSIKGGVKVIERFFNLPLDYTKPDGQKIRVFARNLIPKDKAKTPEDEAKLPYLVFLQGGPGMEVPLHADSEFTKEIHEQGYQTLWLDQRGTGLSSPISAELLTAFATDKEKAEYLKHFRADSIVKDCEAIREILIGEKENPEDRKWTILGQSFGGFCAITYLSFHAKGLKEVFTTGGLAPLVDKPRPVYEATIHQVIKRNKIYYEKYPQDVKRMRDILGYLDSNKVILPNGGHLTPSRWQQLGLDFGASGGIDRIHQLVFRAANDLSLYSRLSYKVLQTVQEKQLYDGNPIYAILHEPIYCQGHAPRWAAASVVDEYRHLFSWSDVKSKDDSSPIYFHGEMIFPSMFDDYASLRPLKGVAEILANDASWGRLYDLEQLAKNEVKVTSVTYVDDMYVEFGFAQDTASKIKNTEQYITNQLFHNGLRADSKDVMKKIFEISKRERD